MLSSSFLLFQNFMATKSFVCLPKVCFACRESGRQDSDVTSSSSGTCSDRDTVQAQTRYHKTKHSTTYKLFSWHWKTIKVLTFQIHA
jgi:hypothetical protein